MEYLQAERLPAFDMVIPADIAYHKGLKDHHILLYGLIRSLTNKYGVCYASNKYMANLRKKTETSISYHIKDLKNFALINSHIFKDEGNIRIIWLTNCGDEILIAIKEFINRGIKENNNTPIKEIFNKRILSIKSTNKEVPPLPPKGGKTKSKFLTLNEFKEFSENAFDKLGQNRMWLYLEPVFEDFFNYRKDVIRSPVKSEMGIKKMVNKLANESNLDYKQAEKMIDATIASEKWPGIYPVNGNGNNGKSVNWFNFKPKAGESTPDGRKVISSISGGFFELDDKTFLKWTGKMWVNVDGQGRGV